LATSETTDTDAISEPERVVRGFLHAWETDGFVPAFERYLHPDAVWQNTGFPDAVGKPACMALLHQYNEFSGMPFGRAELKNISAKDGVVLTERVDHLFNRTGDATHPAAIMGTFVVENGVITRYSDYFDPGPFFAMIEKRARTSAK